MKRYLLGTMFVAILLGGCAGVQKTTTYAPPGSIARNAVMVNLGGLALDYVNLSYYRAFGDHHGFGAYLSYLYHPVGDERITGYGYGLTYRYYPAGKSLARFYFSPSLGVQQGEVVKQDRGPGTGVLLSGVLGWQWFPTGPFAVGLGFGARVILGGVHEDDPVVRDAYGASPIITLDLGYGW